MSSPAYKPLNTGCAFCKAREKVVSEETELRNAPPDFMMPANVFETSIGHFWGIMGTRDYMRARFGLVEAIMELKHERKAVVDALEHLMDLLRLCRSDNMGVREMVPHLMLRLDRDQEAYDFVKWYETEGQRGDYDWGDMDLPFLDMKDADVWDEVGIFCEEYRGLSFVVAVTFLKVKMLIDLRALKEAAAVSGKVPEE
ncbi:hypothetical protein HYALB_00007270 [Hymenoscyphus albidus]|uniref:Uncharacterized protein n=1 Tax=Hymenoscyphus albidus TaxID=595503 RepID=A0A9N9LI86_9HELO|nr:hypothetical protein HYALB_00007270 [Hymenoscyphus albidus]